MSSTPKIQNYTNIYTQHDTDSFYRRKKRKCVGIKIEVCQKINKENARGLKLKYDDISNIQYLFLVHTQTFHSLVCNRLPKICQRCCHLTIAHVSTNLKWIFKYGLVLVKIMIFAACKYYSIHVQYCMTTKVIRLSMVLTICIK